MKNMVRCIVTALSVMIVLGGCSMSAYWRDDNYTSSVKQLVDDCVKYTRIWKEYDENFNYYDTESVDGYIRTLDSLVEIYHKLLMLQPSEKFNDNDFDMKYKAQNALAAVSHIRNHVRYAVASADDTLFQKEKNALFEEYQEYYEGLTQASQYIQTIWRNA